MEKLKYLLGLYTGPDKLLVGGMIMIIFFLASGWTLTEYNYSRYRFLKEKQITDMEREHTLETISFYNRIIEGQTHRQDKLDSALSQVRQILDNRSK